MKTMRKLFTVLLALAMTLALAVPAFAADTGSITITNPQGDHTYTAYKIFDVTYSGDNYSYTISDNGAAFTTVKAYADEAANDLTLTAVANTNKYNVSTGDSFSAASFAQYLKTNVGSLGTGTAFTKDGDTMKASGLTRAITLYPAPAARSASWLLPRILRFVTRTKRRRSKSLWMTPTALWKSVKSSPTPSPARCPPPRATPSILTN